MRKTMAIAAFACIAANADAQTAPITFDQAAFVTCREANGMQPDARKQVAMFLAEHSAARRGVVIPEDQRGGQLAYLVRAGCSIAPDAYLYAVIDRAIVAEQDRLPKRR